MKFAHYVFRIAGIYGLLVLIPPYFVEPPLITLPELYYGFLGVAVAFQLVFLVISTDPQRYRPLVLPSIVEKLSFAVAVFVLVATGRTTGVTVIVASIDMLLGVLFAISLYRLPNKSLNSA